MRKLLLTLIFFLSISLYSEIEKVSLVYDQNQFVLKNVENRDVSYLQNLDQSAFNLAHPGEPNMPYYIVNVAVPSNAVYNGVSIEKKESLFERGVNLDFAQVSTPTMSGGEKMVKRVDRDSKIYSSNSFFPVSQVAYTGEHKMNNYKLFSFLVSPFSYNPITKELLFTTTFNISVDYSLNGKRGVSCVDNGVFASLAKSMVKNPHNVTYQSTRLGSENIQYLIITSAELKASFQPLADWKTRKGVKTKIISTNEIYSTYQGATNQLKIKNCIKDYNQKEGTIYYLLAGDNYIIPDFNAYIQAGGHTDDTAPADLFYATFDGAFDWNGNGVLPAGQTDDNVDLLPDVILTRASVDNSASATAFVNKVLRYETDPAQSDFANKALFVANQLWSDKDSYGKSNTFYKRNFENAWLPFLEKSYDWLADCYVSLNFDKSKDVASFPCTNQNLATTINRGYGIIHEVSHGLQQCYEVVNSKFTVDNAMSLRNNNQGIITSTACLTNAFDNDGTYGKNNLCLSEALLRNPNGGAVAYFGSSRFGWEIVGYIEMLGPSMQFCQVFYKQLFSGMPLKDVCQFGAIASVTKSIFAASAAGYYETRWLMFTINPMGDAEMPIYTTNPTKFILPNIPKSLPIGHSRFFLNTGLSDAKLCLLKDNEIYKVFRANQSGVIDVDFSIPTTGTVKFTLTAHNKIPLQVDIPVSSEVNNSFELEQKQIDIEIQPDQIKKSTIEIKNSGASLLRFGNSFGYVDPMVSKREVLKIDSDGVKRTSGNYKTRIVNKFDSSMLASLGFEPQIEKVLYYLNDMSATYIKFDSFKIIIMEDDNGLPGKTIFESDELKDRVILARYAEYKLPIPIKLNKDMTYYIGYIINCENSIATQDGLPVINKTFLFQENGTKTWNKADFNAKIRLGLIDDVVDDQWFSLSSSSIDSLEVGGSKEILFEVNSKNLKLDQIKKANIVISSLGNEDVNIPVNLKVVNQSSLTESDNSVVLVANYPNPFNPTTTISYSIPQSGVVKIDIYNGLGEFVVNLVNQEQVQGGHSIQFNGSKLNSGVYFYKLQSGNSVVIQKMLLVK